MFSKSGVAWVCFEEVEVEADGVAVVLVAGGESFVFVEGTWDGFRIGVVLEVRGVCFPLFIFAVDGCLNGVLKA